MGFKQWSIRQLPLRYHVPLRYWYRFVTRRLEREWPIVKRIIPRGHVSLDVGANNGVYTYVLSTISRRVEAFEPLPACARTIAAFGARNVGVHQVALSSANGVKELFVPQILGTFQTSLASFTPPRGAFETYSVPVKRLDDYGFDDVSFMKIDVEGHELEVLKGARETIAKCSPILLIEVEQRHLTFPMQGVFEYVLGLGYRGFFVIRDTVSPLMAFSSARHQEPFLDNVLSADYINNFIFVHQSSGAWAI